jgi:integrase
MPRTHVPTYRLHKASGQAVTTIAGVDHYLGKFGSLASKEKYDRLIAEWLAGGRTLVVGDDEPTISELIVRYVQRCERHYQREDGLPTNQVLLIKLALRVLRHLYGNEEASGFGPLKLKTCRQRFIQDGLCRNEVNRRTSLIKQFFRWCVSEELVHPSVYHGLQAVSGLQKGRTEARETLPIQPVSEEHFRAVLPLVPPTVRELLEVAWFAGSRPGELINARQGEIDRSDEVWVLRPTSHKTSHRGKSRAIYLGPKARALIEHRLNGNPTAPLFPTRAGQCYRENSIRSSVQRACKKLGIPKWSLNRIRHARATFLRKELSIEHARAALGHSDCAITAEVYAQRDEALAREAAFRFG